MPNDAVATGGTANLRRSPWRGARGLLRAAAHGMVAQAVMLRAGRRRGRPTVVFLPSRGREMSSLLRIYTIAQALPPLGWRAVVVPWRLDLAHRHAILARLEPDVIVMQGSRHALNRPDLYPGHRLVYDMDDADFHLEHLAAQVLTAMPQVDRVIAGSRYVADWCRAHGAAADVVWTTTPVSSRLFRPHGQRGPVVAWAQTTPASYVRERDFVLQTMRAVQARCPQVKLRLYGRRPGEPDTILAPFRAAGIAVEWLPTMRYDRFVRTLDDVSVGLSPVAVENPFSRGKSFGKILAYLDRGVPVVAGDQVDHPLFFTPDTGVLSNDPAAVARAVCALLESPERRQAMAVRAHARFLRVFSPPMVAARVDTILRAVIAGEPQRQQDAPVPDGQRASA